MADVIVNMAEEGAGFPWHFDTNNFTVTLAIQNAEAGGAFEYAPRIREGDENFAEVARVLDGTSDKVTTLHLEPGTADLPRPLFAAPVAPPAGAARATWRSFPYVEEPGMVRAPERTRQLYGRTLPIHHERAGQRADSYID
ncbi:MAG: hypothetical protein R3D84_12000 [Paracoccaceae bacterium]